MCTHAHINCHTHVDPHICRHAGKESRREIEEREKEEETHLRLVFVDFFEAFVLIKAVLIQG